MPFRFREFIRKHPFNVSLREEAAAPPMGGSPPAPSTPGKTDARHFTMMQGQIGADDDVFWKAMEDTSHTIWLPQDYSKKWGFEVAGSTQATIKVREDGNLDVTFQLPEKKTLMAKSFIYPYKQKDNSPMNYDGKVEEKTVVMTKDEFASKIATPFEMGGAPAGGMGGLQGGMGMPPAGMGGGAPPAPTGAPPATAGGAAPPGGIL